MVIRQITESLEERILSKYAALSKNSRGRLKPERECDLRTCYQRDRDRIIHSKSFRRLKYKTQVLLSPQGDHYRTRLTHTLEVAQIARTISRALRLNEDLTEAIALGHDLGHTPFGHMGEEVLDEIAKEAGFGRFKHAEQSLRVVDKLERDGNGLNLTIEVRDGILKHSKGQVDFSLGFSLDSPLTLEGMVVRISDCIAYLNHDLDDAIRAGLVSIEDLPKETILFLGSTHGERIDRMVKDCVEQSLDKGEISLSKEVLVAMEDLRKFLYERVYIGDIAQRERPRVSYMLKGLYEFFLDHPEHLPESFRKALNFEEKERVVLDYIAGMTDRYALQVFNELLLPHPWRSEAWYNI
ncbi:MAG: deoxyguanosinetriphosphate triphosphohydrolase [Synergistetes bacterium]|nr:deoxyguanosinetriphosphate triphosphohydrolase [Synergistota bacterium]MCX8127312.1 deoxyguanosinetriphosphate triphosphohydrolase [Synergistota bacterium]MDW8191801.1 deoxyguanosinetriphosphate triphosphohydrolase [Synergistota bacterium]